MGVVDWEEGVRRRIGVAKAEGSTRALSGLDAENEDEVEGEEEACLSGGG